MIEALSAWLKQIIIVTLIAAFLDLLLPSSVMQKYVRMVMGLIVVLTMISPLLSVFHTGVDPVDAILQSVVTTGSMPTMGDITEKANQLKQSQHSEALIAWRSQLITLLKDQIRRMYDVQAQTVAIAATSDPNGTPAVTRVDITLARASASDGTALNIIPIAPITIGPNQGDGKTAAGGANTDAKMTATDQTIATKVQTTVANELNISATAVHIGFGNGTGQN